MNNLINSLSHPPHTSYLHNLFKSPMMKVNKNYDNIDEQIEKGKQKDLGINGLNLQWMWFVYQWATYIYIYNIACDGRMANNNGRCMKE